MSVYNDKLILWNPGTLPFDISVEQLKKKHPSRPRNKNIAEIFFRAGHIESWGRGIDKILDAFKNAGLPEPTFEEIAGGVQVTFLKGINTEKYLQALDLNPRQIAAIQYIKQEEKITNTEYQQLNKVSARTAVRDLLELLDKKLLERMGTTGKGTTYILRNK